MEFSFDLKSLKVNHATIPFLHIDGETWFRGNDCATVLGYENQKQAIKKGVDPDWQAPLLDLLEKVGSQRTHPESGSLYNQNDLKSKWITESGVLELISKSRMPLARRFKKWVFGEVLPSIRKTGSYSLPSETIQPTAQDGWAEKRAQGIELMKLKNACLRDLIAGAFGQLGNTVYGVVANHINQAVLGYAESTKEYKRKHLLPQAISIPDILNLQGQIARGYAETCFKQMISDDLERLSKMREMEIFQEFTLMKDKLRECFEKTGMGALQSQVLGLNEAKKRKQTKDNTEALPSTKKPKALTHHKQQKLITCHTKP